MSWIITCCPLDVFSFRIKKRYRRPLKFPKFRICSKRVLVPRIGGTVGKDFLAFVAENAIAVFTDVANTFHEIRPFTKAVLANVAATQLQSRTRGRL